MAIIQIPPKLVKSISKFSAFNNLSAAGAKKPRKVPPEKGLNPSDGSSFGENDEVFAGKRGEGERNFLLTNHWRSCILLPNSKTNKYNDREKVLFCTLQRAAVRCEAARRGRTSLALEQLR